MTRPESRKIGGPVLWIGLFLIAGTLLLIGLLIRLQQLSNRPHAASPAGALPVYSTVGAFQLTNQLGQVVTLESLKGRVWVADIIFTRCPGPCPRMTERLRDLQARLPADGSVRLVTLTTDPGFDTVPVLERYARRFDADPARWWFLTGSKPVLVQLASEGLGLTTVDKPEGDRSQENDRFIHSTVSVIIDRSGRVRGSFETLEPPALNDLSAAVHRLIEEKP